MSIVIRSRAPRPIKLFLITSVALLIFASVGASSSIAASPGGLNDPSLAPSSSASLFGGTAEQIAPAPASTRPSGAKRARIAREFEQLPLAFARNRGQAPKRVRYIANGPGYGIALERDSIELALARKAKHRKRARTAILSLSLRGARAGALQASHRLPGVSNYLQGADRSRWATGVHSF